MKFNIILLFILCSVAVQAQEFKLDKDSPFLGLQFSYGFQSSQADLKGRFGNHLALGSGLEYILPAKKLIVGLQYHFHYGSEVKEDVLAGLRNSQGFLFGSSGGVADVQLRQRGFYSGLSLGYYHRFKDNGMAFSANVGAGLLQHKIRVQDNSVAADYLAGAYLKGYDRLTNGLGLYQSIRFQQLTPSRRLNYHIALELFEGFTQSRRDFDFASGTVMNEKRLDIVVALRFCYYLPVISGKKPEEIYY